jgi:hypothetical protein
MPSRGEARVWRSRTPLGVTFVLLVIAGGLSSSLAYGAPASTDRPLSLMGAQLGMSLADWRKMPPPAALETNVAPTCSNDPNGAIASLKPTATEQEAGVVICSYVSRYGRFSFPQQFALQGRFRTTGLRYDFRNGLLTEIDCDASVDAYDALIAKLKSEYGASSSLVRDHVATELGDLPRVTQTWVTPRGVVALKDPVAPYSQLRLSVAAPVPQAGPGG